MRNIILTMFAALMLIGVSEVKAQKFGHINSAELLEIMPAKTKIQSELESYKVGLENQMKAMTSEYESKVAEYQANEGTWTDVVKQMKVEMINELEGKIQQFSQTAQTSLAEKEQELVKPLLDDAQAAIKKVAKDNGYTYIFDVSSGTILHYPEGDDILPLVKKHLNIQ